MPTIIGTSAESIAAVKIETTSVGVKATFLDRTDTTFGSVISSVAEFGSIVPDPDNFNYQPEE